VRFLCEVVGVYIVVPAKRIYRDLPVAVKTAKAELDLPHNIGG
jgi:hypothetical protein